MSNKEPWGEGTPWKNKSAFMSYVRGAIRRAWMRHPTKLNVIKNTRYKIPNPNPKGRAKTVFGFDCECCGNTFTVSEGHVDHKNPVGSLNDLEDVQGFIDRLLFVREEDLRLICRNCNYILAYQEKHNLTFEQAKVEKKVIAFAKESLTKQLQTLKSLGVVPDKETKVACKKAYRNYLKQREES